MQKTRVSLLIKIAACALLLPLLQGGSCATPTAPDVGVVVQAPKAQLPPVPAVVQQTPAKPAGYFQRSLADYFSGSSEKPTPSTPPTSPVGPTR